MYFYNARWYDPSLGRFTQPDSIVPQPGSPLGWDRYAYVGNNPTNFYDPTGNYRKRDGDQNDRFNKSAYNAYTVWLIPKSKLESYLQKQEGNDDCGPTTMAMVANITLNRHDITHSDVETFLEKSFLKIPRLGIPSWTQRKAMQTVLEKWGGETGYTVNYKSGATLEDIKTNILEGNPTIVTVSWENNQQLINEEINYLIGKSNYGPSVGHVIAPVGYELSQEKFYFLDPGEGKIVVYGKSDFSVIWQQQPNFAITSGNMVSIFH